MRGELNMEERMKKQRKILERKIRSYTKTMQSRRNAYNKWIKNIKVDYDIKEKSQEFFTSLEDDLNRLRKSDSNNPYALGKLANYNINELRQLYVTIINATESEYSTKLGMESLNRNKKMNNLNSFFMKDRPEEEQKEFRDIVQKMFSQYGTSVRYDSDVFNYLSGLIKSGMESEQLEKSFIKIYDITKNYVSNNDYNKISDATTARTKLFRELVEYHKNIPRYIEREESNRANNLIIKYNNLDLRDMNDLIKYLQLLERY